MLQEKNAMCDEQESKNEWTGGWWAGRLEVSLEKEPGQGYIFVFVPEIQSSSHHQARKL